MAISGYTGLPGSGKSYSIFAYAVLPALKEGREVWTNIPFNAELLEADFGNVPKSFTVDEILENDNWFQEVLPKGVLFVLDEAWRLWKSGMQGKHYPEGHASFLAEHRHMVGPDGRSTEIIIATQDLAQISTFARNLVDKTYRTTKLDMVGSSKRFRVDIYQGAVTGPNPPASGRLREDFSKYDKSVYQYYQSHTMSESGSAGNESRADNRHNILRGSLPWLVGGGILAVVIGVWSASVIFSKIFGGDPEPEPDPAQYEDVIYQAGEAPAVVADPEPEVKGILDKFDIEIVWNMGRFPAIDYKFKISDGDNESVVDVHSLGELGYNIKPVNDCLVVLTPQGGYSVHYAMCRPSEERGLVQSLGFGGGADQVSM